MIGKKSITKRLVRDLSTGELIDADSVYVLIPIPEPETPREDHTRHVAPPPGKIRELRDKEANTLRYAFGDIAPIPPVSTGKPSRDWRPLLAFALPVVIAATVALWPLLKGMVRP